MEESGMVRKNNENYIIYQIKLNEWEKREEKKKEEWERIKLEIMMKEENNKKNYDCKSIKNN
jgi:hypothetical protein